MNPGSIHADDMDQVLFCVRRVPEEDQDAAFRFIASRLRVIQNPNDFTVHQVCVDALAKYGLRSNKRGNENGYNSDHD